MVTSVALCTFNGERFLPQQLESILSQSHPVDEIVISDDCSSDGTINIIKGYQSQYDGVIKLFANDKNLGVTKNFEKALKLCNGDIIFFCDQDDVWEKRKVQCTLSFFERHKNVLGAFSDASLIDDHAKLFEISLWQLLRFDGFMYNDNNIFQYIVFFGNVVTGACLAIKKEALPVILPFEKVGSMLHDELTAVKLGRLSLLAAINEKLVQYRLHKDQQTSLLGRIGKIQENKPGQEIIQQETKPSALDHYKFLRKRADILAERQKEGFEFGKDIARLLDCERKSALLAHVRTFPFFKRKRHLLRMFADRKENISLWDILVR